MFKRNRTCDLFGIPTSFSPQENLVISGKLIAEWCIQLSIETVHLMLHSLI